MKYKACRYNGVRMKFHVVVWLEHKGPIPKGYDVHHKNGNRLDNDIGNLELVLHSEHSRIHALKRKRDKKGRWAK